MKIAEVKDLMPGMVLAKNVYNHEKVIIAAKGRALTLQTINRILSNSIDTVCVEDNDKSGIVFEEIIPDRLRHKISDDIKNIDINSINTDAKELFNILQYYNDVSPQFYEEIDDFSFSSVSVAEMSLFIAKKMGFNSEKMYEVIITSLLYDIGKLCEEDRVLFTKAVTNTSITRFLKNPNRYDARDHMVYGYSLLSDTSLKSVIKNSVLKHHENPDGKGVLGFDDIHDYAKIIRITDFYLCAINAFKEEIDVNQILNFMIQNANKIFDEKMLKEFLKFPFYAPSSVLKLNWGNKTFNAIVLKNNINNNMRPVVQLENGEEINLSEPERSSIEIKTMESKRPKNFVKKV